MNNQTTILLNKETVNLLKKTKEYPRQTYDLLLRRMVELFNGLKKKNQYDEFLHKTQQPKMKELWDNEEDEAWGSA